MTGALIILAVTVVTGLILWLTYKPENESGTITSSEVSTVERNGDEDCCGIHAVCEKKIAGMGQPLYFDDEELDRFSGREPQSYSEEEIEEFRDILYTLLPEDVYPWGASLTLRNVSLPEQLRDEWVMLSQG
ncbi:MAG: phospholipase [Muribaculum sp.]|nr:phospholipase [Muribaculum sp.]